MIDGVYEGFAKRARGPLAELCRGFDPTTFVYETDLTRVRELFREAGVAEGTALRLLLPPGNPENRTIAELFQANLATSGVNLEIEEIEFATYVAVFLDGEQPADERPHVWLAFSQPDYNDGWSQLDPILSCASWGTGNGGHYCNARVEHLLAEARDAADEASYQAALSELQQIVTHDDPAAIYFAETEWPTVLRRDIDGFAPNRVAGHLVDFYALSRRQ